MQLFMQYGYRAITPNYKVSENLSVNRRQYLDECILEWDSRVPVFRRRLRLCINLQFNEHWLAEKNDSVSMYVSIRRRRRRTNDLKDSITLLPKLARLIS